MRKKMPLIIGIVLALVAAYLIKVYTDQQRSAVIADANRKLAKIQSEQVSILVATKDLPKGAVLDQNSVEAVIVLKQYVQPQAATSLDRVSGMLAVVPISKGEQITLNKFISAKEAGISNQGSLAMVTPIGKRAVTISVDSISAVGGMVRPGDYVDVVAMINVPMTTAQGKQASQPAAVPLFQNVLVLAIGQNLSSSAEQDESESRYKKSAKKSVEASPLITLALNPKDANLLSFIQDQGKIRLALRSPSDAKIEQVSPASWDSVFQYLMPPETADSKKQGMKTSKESEPESYVEIYRGMNKDKIPVYK